MSIDEVIKLLQKDNVSNSAWVADLQRKLYLSNPAKYNKNYNYCKSCFEDGGDGDLGPNTRADLIAFLQDHPKALLDLGPKMTQHLYDQGYSRALQNIVKDNRSLQIDLRAEIDCMMEGRSLTDLSKDELKKVQTNWKLLGEYTGRIDGLNGPKTRDAYKYHTPAGCGTSAEEPSQTITTPVSYNQLSPNYNLVMDFNSRSSKEARARRLLSENIQKTSEYYRGTRYVSDGKSTKGLDCSEFIVKVFEGLSNGEGLIDQEHYNAFKKTHSFASAQMSYLHKTQGIPMNETKNLKASDIKGGMLIALDTGYKGWDRGRYKGINHIAITFEGEDGQVYVAECTADRVNLETGKIDRNGERGMIIMPAEQWLTRFNGRSRFCTIDLVDAVDLDAIEMPQPQIADQTLPFNLLPTPVFSTVYSTAK